MNFARGYVRPARIRKKTMTRNNACKSKIRKFSYGGLLLAALSLMGVTLTLSADDRKVETIDATAMGTSTQLGKMVNVKVTSTNIHR